MGLGLGVGVSVNVNVDLGVGVGLDVGEGNTWGVPGGKKDSGECLIDAVIREVMEETGCSMDSEHICYFDTLYVTYLEFQFIYHIFSYKLERKPNIRIREAEHKNYIWLAPKKAMELDLIQDLDYCIKYFYKV